MKPGLFQQIILYRYRYAVGYTLFILFGVIMMTWQIRALGPGLAEPEKLSALASATWQWENWKEAGLQVVNLPYLLLQKASIAAFGLSAFSVRLPSITLGLATSALFFCLMRLMHRSHVALAASVLFAASSWYIAVGRLGAPLIMIPFVWVLLTYSFVRLIRLDDPPLAWAALGGLSAALALYTPYGMYGILSAALILGIHPEIRRRLGALTGQQVALALFIFIPMLVPLGWGLFKDTGQLWALSGLSSTIPSPADFVQNIGHAISAIAWKAPALPMLRLDDLPLMSVGAIALLLAGVYRALRDWRSMRTQFILFSTLVIILLLGMNPKQQDFAVLVVPCYMLIASGITVLFREWYKLFPRNPYARSFGLIPIVVFLSFIVVYHYQRYFVAWANAPQTYHAYNTDLDLVRDQLGTRPNLAISVPEQEVAFYQVLVRKFPEASVSTTPKPDQPLLVRQGLSTPAETTVSPVVNEDTNDAIRFWLVLP